MLIYFHSKNLKSDNIHKMYMLPVGKSHLKQVDSFVQMFSISVVRGCLCVYLHVKLGYVTEADHLT